MSDATDIGGCFLGSCLVRMADGSKKHISKLEKGDTLEGGATVQCKVVTLVCGRPIDVTRLPDSHLELSPYHPVKWKDEWVFPHDIDKAMTVVRTDVDEIYGLLLSEGQGSVAVEGVECATLAHGLTDNAVITHPFLGTEAAREALKRMKGFDVGLVEVDGARRDPATQKINGWIPCLRPAEERRRRVSHGHVQTCMMTRQYSGVYSGSL